MKKILIVSFLAIISICGFAQNLEIIPLSDNAVRVKYHIGNPKSLDELIYVNISNNVKYKKTLTSDGYQIKMKGMTVVYNSSSDVLSFFDNKGNKVLEEKTDGRKIARAADIEGEYYSVQQSFLSPKDEHLYGLGQFQDGFLNIRGITRLLTQVNTQISIPMFISSKGYGLLWNNYGQTVFNPSNNSVTLAEGNGEGEVTEVNTTSTTGNLRERRVSDTFSGNLTVDKDGEYSFLLNVGQKMARRLYMEIDGEPVINQSNMWLPPTGSAKVQLKAGQHHILVKGVRGDHPSVSYSLCEDMTTLQSPVATHLDYTVFVGNADQIVSSYRHLTGKAPLMPDYMLGYIHCRERYDTQEELLSNARKFKEKNIPVSVIVQDWQWWGKYGWNAMQWDEGKYPDPAAMVRELHSMDMKLMLSVWSKIDQNCELGKQMKERGGYISGTDWIDFFKPDIAQMHWKNFSSRLLKPFDIDAWWFDATEPENDDITGRRIGPDQIQGEIYRNVYPLKVIETMYNGLIRDDKGRTPSILTRSAFTGMQRFNAVTWSGDVGNDMDSYRRQIIGGLGYVSTGIPWWTYDAGGFFRPGNQYTDEVYQNRMLRWIENSVFLPLMRVHGYQSRTEPWNYSQETERIFVNCIKERYELMPYIKNCAKMVAEKDYTLMRPLVFDFADDEEALRQETEYMFGPTYLVCPVTQDGATEWKVYLPKNKKGWKEHYTGKQYSGGEYVTVPLTKEHIPVFERK